VAPFSLALVVALDCSLDRSGLEGDGGSTVAVGAGGGSGGSAGGGSDGARGGAGAGNSGSGGGVAGTLGVAGNAVGTGGAGGAPGTAGAVAGTGGTGGDSGETDDAGGGLVDAPAASSGCADGTREAFTDQARFPAIAGCAGAWSVPGLLTDQSMAPGCARAAGNDGSNPTGGGCTVEDLCADGWHVCSGAGELTLAGVTCQDAGIAPATAGGAMFFATRQHGTAPTGCSPTATTGSNNLHGCGNFGRVEDPGCAPPLDRQLESTVCATNPPWSCTDPTSIMTEAMVVTKSGSARGGVLCCQ